MRVVLLFLLIGIVSCSTANQTLSPDVVYMDDIGIQANGYQGIGILALPQASSYDIKLDAAGKINLLDFSSCHRTIIKQKSGSGNIFNPGDKIEINYVPAAGIEDNGNCDIDIRTYNIQSKNSVGYIVFQNPKYQLPATLNCNGSTIQSPGESVCSAKQTLYQTISFTVPVKVTDKDAQLYNLTTTDNKAFRYQMPLGTHKIEFIDQTTFKLHRLVTRGFQQARINL